VPVNIERPAWPVAFRSETINAVQLLKTLPVGRSWSPTRSAVARPCGRCSSVRDPTHRRRPRRLRVRLRRRGPHDEIGGQVS
jgi:hypothetical protein